MLSVALCEDETDARLALSAAIRRHLKEADVEFGLREFVCGESLLSCGARFDLAVMDVQMKGIDGLETAKRLQRRDGPCSVIFVTSYPDHVYESFAVDVVDYILKPVSPAKFAAAMDKALKHFMRSRTEDFVVVKNGPAYHKLLFGEILYCESVGHKIKIRTLQGTVEYYDSIESLHAKLGGDFFRCHRAFVVNLVHVKARNREDIILENGEIVPLARRRQQEFTSALLALLKRDPS